MAASVATRSIRPRGARFTFIWWGRARAGKAADEEDFDGQLKCVFMWMEAYNIACRDNCYGLEVGNTVGEGKTAVAVNGKGGVYEGRSIIGPRRR